MKKILVTGGAGYIGSHTIVDLIASGYEPVILDNFSNSDRRVLDGLFRITGKQVPVYDFDCADKEKLSKLFLVENPDGVIHFAADKAVGESVSFPLKYYRNNIVSLVSLLEVLKDFSVPNLVFSSSCTVYGQPDNLPVTEESPVKESPSPYGYTMQVSERIIRDTVYAHPAFSAVLLRYFNPIGAHRSGIIGELPFGVPNNLVPFLVQTVAGIRDHLTVYGNDYSTPDGSCIRDYIHVVDLARAHVQSLEWLKENNGQCEVFNLGQGRGHSVLEVIKSFEDATGKTVSYRVGARRPGDVEQIWADVTKAEEVLKWKTQLGLGDALRDAWNWQQQLVAAGIKS
ncbi:MAG: UDP-glucose 4-epimerase GalE [Crocinitomicaceae bacterium]|nr:UDP-glucose 4-epimerase GalE [Crocinitomicaceae bacterium]